MSINSTLFHFIVFHWFPFAFSNTFSNFKYVEQMNVQQIIVYKSIKCYKTQAHETWDRNQTDLKILTETLTNDLHPR